MRWQLVVESPVGPLRLAASEDALVALHLPDDGAAAPPDGQEPGEGGHALLAAARRQLEEWFAGRRLRFDLPLRPSGTPFQLEVWRALGEIAFGETRTYAEIAARVGRPGAARAVGAASGRNPLAILVPCHRVLGARGALTGYAGGLERKRWLLAHERSVRARALDGPP